MSKFGSRIIEGRKRWGRIINISADCARGAPMEISYRASKYALESYSRSAAAELGPYGITVNIVSPGPVQSGYIPSNAEETLITDIPLKKIGQPEDIANAVVFFASEQAAWITGQLLFVHGGHRMTLGPKRNDQELILRAISKMPNSPISLSDLNGNPQNIYMYCSGYVPTPSLTSNHFSVFEMSSINGMQGTA